MEFLRNAPEGTYDAIIVDSSDPIGELMLQHIVFLGNIAMEIFSYSWEHCHANFSYVLVLYICSVPFSLLPIVLFLNSMLYFY